MDFPAFKARRRMPIFLMSCQRSDDFPAFSVIVELEISRIFSDGKHFYFPR